MSAHLAFFVCEVILYKQLFIEIFSSNHRDFKKHDDLKTVISETRNELSVISLLNHSPPINHQKLSHVHKEKSEIPCLFA